MSPLLDESAILGKGEICEDPKMAFPRRVEGCFEFGCHGECYWYLECCGGYGDPLHRDPALVEADLRAGKVTARAAADVYGVVTAPSGGAVDIPATDERRRTLRSERLAAASPRPQEGT